MGRTQLTLADTYSYTPLPPAFLAGDLTGQGANPFVSGYQVSRVNTQRNVFDANLVAPLTPVVNLLGSYSNGFLQFGGSPGQQAVQLLDTNYQTYKAGLSRNLSLQDTVNMQFVESDYDYHGKGTFTTRGGTFGWMHQFSPSLSLTSAAGAQVVDTNFVGTTAATYVAPLGNLTLLWKDSTTALTLSYGIGVTPSFQFQSAPLRTQVLWLNLTQQTGIPELLVVVGLNYGHGSQIGGGNNTMSYDSYSAFGGFAYHLTPQTYLALTYSYSNNNNSFGGRAFLIEREVVQFSLSMAFY